MTDTATRPLFPPVTQYTLLALVAAALYFSPPVYRQDRPHPRGQFMQLAAAFLRGELTIPLRTDIPVRKGELIPTGDPSRAFCPYPPLPAVLLMPFVLILGPDITIAAATRYVSVINVLLFHACIGRLHSRLGFVPFSARQHWTITAFFAFGTTAWPVADTGADWHLAHAVALGAQLLAFLEYAGKGRPGLIGALVGLAALSRPTTIIIGMFFLLQSARRRDWGSISLLCIGPAIAVFLLGAYNAARFGSPFDFAYDRMQLRGEGAENMRQFGQFSIAYLPRNFFWFFLAPPVPLASGRFPWMGYDLRGMSLFLASPAFLYAMIALRRIRTSTVVRDAAVTLALSLIPLLLYFNTGYAQFGHRFSMDYMPLLLILMVAGVQPRLSRVATGFVLLSIVFHAAAVFVRPIASLPLNIPPLAWH
ncbi:MAG TPA: glycosyltransferase family 87 protein [Phycisphaerae bacterium]|nr:glycosyltransferase family 87 protein [Phycisphaerae bacterium]